HSIVSGRLGQSPRQVMIAGLSVAAVATAAIMIGAIGFSTPNPIPVVVISVVALAAFLMFSRRHEDSPPRTDEPPAPTGHPASQVAETTARPEESPGSALLVRPPVDVDVATRTTTPEAAPAAEPQRDTLDTPWRRTGSDEPGDQTSSDAPFDQELFTDPPVRPPAASAAESPAPRPCRRPQRPRGHLFGITMGLTAIALGIIWAVDASTETDVSWSAYPGAALGLTAIALVVGTWFGRSRGLIFVGVVSALSTLVFSVVDHGPLGARIYEPQAAAQVSRHYDHGAGLMSLHLEQVAGISQLDGRVIHLTSSVGQVRVSIPSSVDATVHAHVDAGWLEGPENVSDLGNGEKRATMTPIDDADPNITLDIDLTYGDIRIERFQCPFDAVTSTVPEAGQSTIDWTGDDRDPAACN
ncbi:MAG: hypothetical protein ACRDP4_03950, partial [Nocardioidaceae bacterium]